MGMTQEYKNYRRSFGMAQFEKNCRLTPEMGRMKKAWKVPGTQEHGKHAMLFRMGPDKKYS